MTRYQQLITLTQGASEAFDHACEALAEQQASILFSILKRNSSTPYGKECGFDGIRSLREFNERVPITDYQSYLDFGDRKHQRFLAETPETYAYSSGSSSTKKSIPLTPSLQIEFEQALFPWFDALFSLNPELLKGPSYWILSPPLQEQSEVDACYFRPEVRDALYSMLLVPPRASREGGFSQWSFLTLLTLILTPDLTWISLWNPTLLLELLEAVSSHESALLQVLECGRVEKDVVAAAEVRKVLEKRLFEARKRLRSIIGAVKRREWSLVWPELKLISCWTDAWAGLFEDKLRRALPHAKIEPKGLLATECVISFPLTRFTSGSPILAFRSHFLEFRSPTSGKLYGCEGLQEGETYEVIVTTGGGLYRYRLGDLVTVTGFYRTVPQVKFVGKVDNVSDLCGEKLHEAQVTRALALLSKDLNLDLSRAQLCGVIEPASRYYELALLQEPDGKAVCLAAALDAALKENPHYFACREHRQLDAVRCVVRAKDSQVLLSTQKEQCLAAVPSVRVE